MAISIYPLEESDVQPFVRLELEAFRSHPRIPILWPRGYTDDLYAYYEDRKTKMLHDPDCRLTKALDSESGEMMAVSEWNFILDANASANEQPIDPNEQPPADWPKGGNWELKLFFKIEWQKWRRETLAGMPYIELQSLVGDPRFQGRGAGTKLLTWGCEQADKHGVMMWLESTPAGLSLYKRFSFREVRTVKADMRLFGWDKPYDEEAAKRVWMVRDVQSHAG